MSATTESPSAQPAATPAQPAPAAPAPAGPATAPAAPVTPSPTQVAVAPVAAAVVDAPAKVAPQVEAHTDTTVETKVDAKAGKAAARKAEKKPRPEKRVKASFKLAAGERKRLETMRDELGATGRKPSRSKLVRAALGALATHSGAEIQAMVTALPALAKAESRKKNKR